MPGAVVVLVVSNCSTTRERELHRNVAEIPDSIVSFGCHAVDYSSGQFAVRHRFYSIAAIQP